MRMDGQRESDNVEDDRGGSGGGGGGGLPMFGGRSIGLGTIAIALVGGWIFGINPVTILNLLSGGGGACQSDMRCASSSTRRRNAAWKKRCPC